MREALRLARAGADAGEVPVGAVVAIAGETVGRGWMTILLAILLAWILHHR